MSEEINNNTTDNNVDVAAQLDLLRKQNEELAAWKHDREIQDAIAAKGLPAKVGKLFAVSGAESIDKFLEEYGDVVGGGKEPLLADNPAVVDGFKRLEQATVNTSNADMAQLDALKEAAAKGGVHGIAAWMNANVRH